MKVALFPGSFDPITTGHVEIIERGLSIFDKIVVAIGVNANKKYMFSVEDRIAMLTKTFAHDPSIEIAQYQTLTVNFAKEKNISFILRGLRAPSDLEYEQPIAYVNQHLSPEIEIVCLLSKPETAHISSSVVREIIRYQGNLNKLVPPAVIEYIFDKNLVF